MRERKGDIPYLKEATKNEDEKPSVESCTNVGKVSLGLKIIELYII